MEDHNELTMEFDRPLIIDVLDSTDLRYVTLYMFFIRKELFRDLEDDDIIEQFDSILHLEEPTVQDLKRICDEEFLQNLFNYNVITNIKSLEALKVKGDSVKVRLAQGLKLEREDVSGDEEEIHILCREDYLERVITAKVPEMTAVRIHKALERLRAMMCPRTNKVHTLIKKFGDYYVLADDFYYIIEQVGNPYQALRVELMIRAMADKYKEIGTQLDELLEQFDSNLTKADMMNKFRKAKEKQKTDYIAYLIEKSRKLPTKYNPKFPKDQNPELYLSWKTKLNELIGLKLTFDDIDQKMDKLRAYYSGAKQVMPYLTFIEKTTYDDEIADQVKGLLVGARNDLKGINDQIEKYTKKDLRLLNIDLERLIIDLGIDEEEEKE
jgi:hypothetical protein